MYVYYATKPLTSSADQLYRVNLPNIDDNGSVCLGTYWRFRTGRLTLAQSMEDVLQFFWGSEFNRHYNGRGQGPYVDMTRKDTRLASVLEWERQSQVNPLFILDVQWQPVGLLRDICRQLNEQSQQDASLMIATAVKEALGQEELRIGRFVDRACAGVELNHGLTKLAEKTLAEKLGSLRVSAMDKIKERFHALRLNGKEALEKRLIEANTKSVQASFKAAYQRISASILMRRGRSGREIIQDLLDRRQ